MSFPLESQGASKEGLLARLDKLYEFERQPVTEDKLQPGAYFAGVYSGEHIGATEFVIGAAFVSFGATAYDVIVGLLIGNLLAVLSWTLVCAPIAYQTRLTLYWYLRKIAGPAVTIAYNVLNAILHCILAGAMFTVSASALRIYFGIPPQTGWLPTDYRFVILVLVIGALVVTLAILGFKRLAQFSTVCSPWMVLMFVVGALVTLPVLGHVTSLSKFWEVAQTKIWIGPQPGQEHPLGFWHVAAFAWVCNLATHLGLSDMALFRFAKRPWYGVYSAFGMYLGHCLAWICAGIMGAATAALAKQPLMELDSGAVAHSALGAMGALCVLLAGWTTANPTLYRAGLAFQAVTPGWPRWLVTLLAGVVTTIVACSPFVFLRLLDFVAIYGILLFPVGAIVIAEHWIFPRFGFTQFWSTRKGQLLNWPALAAWLAGVGLAVGAWITKTVYGHEIIHEFFLAIPVWIVTTLLYIVLAALAGARESIPAVLAVTTTIVLPASRTESTGAARLAAAEIVLYYASGLAAIGLLGWWVVGDLLSTMQAAGGEAATGIPQMPQSLGPLQLGFFVSAAIWFHFREKALSWDWTLALGTGVVALASLVLCLAYAVSVFLGLTRADAFRAHLVVLSIVYFISSVVWLRQWEKRSGRLEKNL
jgi:NCS1 family nucleobase:cation symporter-1